MQGTKRKLVTVVAEAAIEKLLAKDLADLGLRGYTILDARGVGARGVRPQDWEQSGNVCFQIVCGEADAQALLARVRDTYWTDWAVVCWVSDVEVFRPEKF